MRDIYMQKLKRSRHSAGLPFGLEQDLGQNLSALGKLCHLNLPQILAIHWDKAEQCCHSPYSGTTPPTNTFMVFRAGCFCFDSFGRMKTQVYRQNKISSASNWVVIHSALSTKSDNMFL